MAITDWRKGFATNTEANLMMRSDTNGIITVDIDNRSFDLLVDASVKNGIVAITVNSLTAETEYYAIVKFNDQIAFSCTLKTTSNEKFKLAWMSCVQQDRDLIAGHIIAKSSIDLTIMLGDFPYSNSGSNFWGIHAPSSNQTLAHSQDESNYNLHHQQMWKISGVKAMLHSHSFIYMADDHEWAGDNFDHSEIQVANVNGNPTWTQTDIDEVFNAGNKAVRNYSQTNPPNLNSIAVAQKAPACAVGTAVSNYEPRYFAYSPNSLVRIIVIDCISHRSMIADSDSATKTILGTVQDSWLEDELLNSPEPYKFIGSPKKFFNTASDNGDTIAEYQTWRNNIMNFISDNNITSVFVGAGDRHIPDVSKNDVRGHICVNSCPGSVDNNLTGQGAGYPENIVYKPFGFDGVRAASRVNAFATATFTAQFALFELIDTKGFVHWQGYMRPGSNRVYEHANHRNVI